MTKVEINQQKHLYLVDGYGFVFRAYHAIRPLSRPDGTPVNAVFGFTRMLMNLKMKVRNSGASCMLVVFDAGKKSFRNEIYPEYKANRPPAPDDLIPQFAIVREAVKAMSIPACELEGYEADDIIATYTEQAKKQGMKVTIVSSDKDLMQLVGGNVDMYDAMKDKRIAEAEVEEKFGIGPELVLDALALIGDSSDNIPGVPGIGPKTAAELLQRFGSLDEILANTDKITQNKRRETLQDNKEQALLSRELATLHYEVPLDLNINDLGLQDEDSTKIAEFLNTQNFKSLAVKSGIKFNENAPSQISANSNESTKITADKTKFDYELIDNEADLKAWLAGLEHQPKLAIMPIFNGNKEIIGITLAKQGSSVFLPLTKEQEIQVNLFDEPEENQSSDGFNLQKITDILAPYIADNALLKISPDSKMLNHIFIQEKISQDDILLMSYVLDGTKNKREIASLANTHLGMSVEDFDKISKEFAKSENNIQEFSQKFCAHGEAIFKLHKIFYQRLFDEKMLKLYMDIEKPLINVLSKMEQKGIKLDMQELKRLSEYFGSEMARLEKEIHICAGEEFNIGSPKQMGEILFEKMGIEGGKKTKSGTWATGADMLEKLSLGGHIIADHLLSWRTLSKLKSTYSDSLAKLADVNTARVHTNFAMKATTTGRLSSLNPNLQNIPIRTEEGRKIRKCFIAEKGNKLISADYSQIELRLLAHMADIDVLKDAFRNGKDIHAITASQIFSLPLEEVTSEIRRSAKAINFGIIYGQSAFGLAKQINISRTEAKEYIEKYFQQYPGIRHYMDATIEYCKEHGYVKTLLGRKCFMPDINSSNGALRQFAERAAINAPLQGTAADIIKKAMVKLPSVFAEKSCSAQILLQIHDELIIEVPASEAETASKIVKNTMENVTQISIPLTVEAEIGDNWADIH